MDNILQFLNNNPVLKIVANVIIVILLLVPLNLLFYAVFKKVWKEKAFDVRNAYKRLKLPLLWTVISVLLFITINIYQLPGSVKLITIKIISVFIIFSVAWLLIRILRILRNVAFSRLDIGSEDNLKARKTLTQLKIFEKFITFIIILVAVSSALMLFDKVRQMGVNILASAGVAGIIVGFAAQKSIANILAGIQIAITQPIRIDDVVIIEGEWGRIEEINLTYVVVKIWDMRRLIVPINYFIDKPFQNWTRTNAEILGTVFIYVDYLAPVKEIREELTRLLKLNENWDGNVNAFQVTSTNDKTMELRALMSAKNASAAFELRVYIREKLIEYLQKNYPEHLPKIRIENK